MYRLTFVFLLMGINGPLFAQNGYWQTGATEAGIAHATAAFSGHNLMFHNIGSLGKVQRSSITAGYDYRGFITGLNNISLQYIQKGKKFNYGSSIFRSGDDVLNEFVASVGVGQQLGIASLGIKVNYYQVFSEAFGYSRAYTLTAGGIAELFTNFYWGTYIENAAQYKAADHGVEIPIIFSSGMAYYPLENLMLIVSGTMEGEDKLKVSTGISYAIIPEVKLRTGVDLYYRHMHYGIGFELQRFNIDYALSPVTRLGNVHSLSLQLKFKNK